MYSLKAVLRATRVGLRSRMYQRTIAKSLLARLKGAISKDDNEAVCVYAAGIVALNALKSRA